MPPRESRYYRDWLTLAERDLQRAETMLSLADNEDAAFHLQQALEKYLKAYLLSRGWRLRPTHDLSALLNECLAYNSALEAYRLLCASANEYYIQQRYPFLPEVAPSGEDLRSLLAETHQMIAALFGSESGSTMDEK